MLAQENRFTQKNFEFLRRKMKSFRSGDFLFFFGDGRERTRFAVVVSKKVEKLAVNRNRFRRQVYEYFRKEYLPQCQGFNIICLYKGTKIPKNTAEFSVHLTNLVQKIQRKNTNQN